MTCWFCGQPITSSNDRIQLQGPDAFAHYQPCWSNWDTTTRRGWALPPRAVAVQESQGC